MAPNLMGYDRLWWTSASASSSRTVKRSEARLSVPVKPGLCRLSEVGLDGRLLFANDQLCEMLGYTRDELLRRRLSDIADPEAWRVQAQLDSLSAAAPTCR
jgi:PAS domain-containing protein